MASTIHQNVFQLFTFVFIRFLITNDKCTIDLLQDYVTTEYAAEQNKIFTLINSPKAIYTKYVRVRYITPTSLLKIEIRMLSFLT